MSPDEARPLHGDRDRVAVDGVRTGENYVARPYRRRLQAGRRARSVGGDSLARGQEPEGSRQAEVGGGVTQPDHRRRSALGGILERQQGERMGLIGDTRIAA
jgi:hypothetical protein